MRVWIRPAASSAWRMAPMRAVHHVAGRDDVHAGFGLGERLLHQHLRRSRRSGCSRSSSSRPSWPWLVKGSSATSVITPRPGNSFFSARTTRGHQAVGVDGFAADRVFQRRADDREQRHHRDAQFRRSPRPRAAAGPGSGAPRRAWRPRPRGGSRLRARTPGRSGRCTLDRVLAHQVAGEFVAAQAARTALGVGGVRVMRKIVPENLPHARIRGTGSGCDDCLHRARRGVDSGYSRGIGGESENF